MSYSEPWRDDFEDNGLAWTSNRIELRGDAFGATVEPRTPTGHDQ